MADAVDLLIIGAGPAGISLGAEARAAGMERVIVLEKAEAHSWTIRKLYPDQKEVLANYKGHAAVCRGVVCITDDSKTGTLSYLDSVIRDFRLEVRYRVEVTWISPQPDGSFEVRTASDEVFSTRALAVAIGIWGKPRKPDYPIPGSLRDKVLYEVTGDGLSGLDVLVVGGGDSASEYAQFLVQEGNTTVLSYRQSEFNRMLPVNREAIEALEERGMLTILRGSNIAAVTDHEGDPHVEFVESIPSLVVDRVVYALGGQTPRAFLRQIGIEFDGHQPIVTDHYETTVPGLYLVGDLVADGRGGGSIITAFNSSADAWTEIAARLG